MSGPLAETSSGWVRGRPCGPDALFFGGIPYALPPVGRRRFAPPQPPAVWAGIRDAASYGSSCPQPPLAPGAAIPALGCLPSPDERYDEDCLVCNVWTPSTRGHAPVLVRFHGGSFVAGSGSWPWCDGAVLACRHQVVVVTVNHRLGLLGHLDLSAIGSPEYGQSANAGILDLVRALEWIRHNIASFGGDPGRVTICGESGGGMKVGALLVMPSARGLFSAAVIESGPLRSLPTPEDAAQLTDEALQELDLGRRQADRLWELPVEQLVAAQRSMGARKPAKWAPVADTQVVPDQPVAALTAGEAADVPLIMGTNKDEAAIFRAATPDVTHRQVWAAVTAAFPEHGSHIVEAYRRLQPAATAWELLVAVQSDYLFRIPTLRMLEARVRGNYRAAAYLYLLTFDRTTLGAFHGLQVPLCMGNWSTAEMLATEPEAGAVGRVMSGAWASFAEQHASGRAPLSAWAPYRLSDRATMVFDVESSLVCDPNRAERAVWEGVI